MKMVDTEIRNAKPRDKAYRLHDAGGLYLEVAPTGGKWWRFKYHFEGKEKRISLGVYPKVGLRQARDRRDEARRLLSTGTGIDPSTNRQAVKQAAGEDLPTFEVVAREFLSKRQAVWARSHGDRIMQRFERDVFPWIGNRLASEIKPQELLAVIRRIESRGAHETAHRALSNCGQVFRYAVATSRAERDLTTDLRGALDAVKGTHFASITEPTRVADLLRVLDGYQGSLVVRCALRLAPLVFVRPGELRTARWADIDFEAREWRFVVTKTKKAHIVPLSEQSVAVLVELKPLTEDGEYVFPSARTKARPMSDNAVLAALRRLGIGKDEMSGHGFRAMARTILDEVLGVRSDYIEHQLAHAVRDPNGRAYNRTAHLPERRKMMQQWADYLDGLRVERVATVTSIGARAKA